MAELITLTSPVDTPKTVFRIALLAFDWMNATITIHVRDFNPAAVPPAPRFGERVITAFYSGDEATQLMIQLNKINLSTQSLHQRVMTRLLADGKLPAGTASGVPD